MVSVIMKFEDCRLLFNFWCISFLFYVTVTLFFCRLTPRSSALPICTKLKSGNFEMLMSPVCHEVADCLEIQYRHCAIFMYQSSSCGRWL